MTQYTIFGAGPGGLYTAWRLVTSGTLVSGDSIQLFEWGNYAFEAGDGGTRLPAGRICTQHYQDQSDQSYIEIGGMRFLEWDPSTNEGHQLVTKTISALGMDSEVVPFLTTDDPLFYLRGVTFYQDQLGNGVTAPYNTPGNNEKPADQLFGDISALMTAGQDVTTRADQCNYYANGVLPSSTSSVVYNAGDNVGNIGYWNFFYDQAGNEGFNYAADAGGYSSNVINWNAANAAVYNGEFAPGGAFKTLKCGYSQLFVQLYQQAKAAATAAGISFTLTSQTRLHSIWKENGVTTFQLATAANPDKASGGPQTTDYAFLAMPRHSVELIASATRYIDMAGKVDFLNATPTQNYIESVIEQPSYKVAMFFDTPWWESSKYPPKLVSSHGSTNIFGPTITDLPLRQIYYFGNNAESTSGTPVYGLLASYDDMRFVTFWEQMQLELSERRQTPQSQDREALTGALACTESMVQMLRLELAKVHYADADMAWSIPEPLESYYLDWKQEPFGAGYHAWAPHYDIVDVMQKIRTPAALGGVASDQSVFLVGSAYSNDQAWVEGAFCTAESVLTEYLGITTIADTANYPLICSCGQSCSVSCESDESAGEGSAD